MTDPLFDPAQWRPVLSDMSQELSSATASADPLLWAAAHSIESARFLLQAYGHAGDVSEHDEVRAILLDAVSSARAAVGAATYAIQEHYGQRPGP
jgi:hypothetical protein